MARHLIHNFDTSEGSSRHVIACDRRTRLDKKYFVKEEWLATGTLPSCKKCKEMVDRTCSICHNKYLEIKYWSSYSICQSCVDNAVKIKSSIESAIMGGGIGAWKACLLCSADGKSNQAHYQLTLGLSNTISVCLEHSKAVSEKMIVLLASLTTANNTVELQEIMHIQATMPTNMNMNAMSNAIKTRLNDVNVDNKAAAANMLLAYVEDTNYSDMFKDAVNKHTYNHLDTMMLSIAIINDHRHSTKAYSRIVNMKQCKILMDHGFKTAIFGDIPIVIFTEKQSQIVNFYIKSDIESSGISLLEFMTLDR